ncbi:MAG: hypothetical protein D6734_00370 [Candidatus Schekmanbacteria bacterium]|nr:MAG: hypothetical protein D6734_00370 [Candidatus Schekmanbacteria bacterium]
MKWFFALNDVSHEFEAYSNMLKVAVHTALKYTSLSPYFLYDGKENALTDWLRERDVKIIFRRSFLYEKLKEISEKENDTNYLSVGAGTFLRIEIPQLTLEMGIPDEYVLYTDVDVMFLSDVNDYMESLKPHFFAVAPEFYIDNYRKMNVGVMLMNLKNLRTMDKKFLKFTEENIEYLAKKVWDQTAYHKFYKKWWKNPEWDRLSPEYNWKPYWGKDYSSAKIIHFHGPKPYQREMLQSANMPENIKSLKWLAKGAYYELSELWSKMLKEAEENFQ